MSSRDSFLWGLFGAILPELLRLYKIAVGGHIWSGFTWFYLLMSVFFVLAAGLFTTAWKPENAFKAIWVGVSFPVLVSTLMNASPKP